MICTLTSPAGNSDTHSSVRGAGPPWAPGSSIHIHREVGEVLGYFSLDPASPKNSQTYPCLPEGKILTQITSASDFGSGRDLAVREFEPRVGLCAGSSEPGACFGFCVSLSLPLPHSCLCSLSLSKINKHLKQFV